MHIVILSLFSLIFLMTGCTNQSNYVLSDSKRVTYQSVKDSVRDSKIEGDYLFKKGYFLEAITAYNAVNFYEDKNIISSDKIKTTKRRANANGKYYYDSALKNKKNKKKSLIQLNRVFRNTATYKNSQTLFDELKKDPKIILLLESLEKPLKVALVKSESIKKINTLLQKIAIYDDSNSVVIEAKDHIRNESRKLIHDGIALYNAKRYNESLRKFKIVKTIYQDSEVIDGYIRKMKRLKTAKPSKSFNKVDTVDKDIIRNLITKGKAHYNKQDFKNAKESFARVLQYELDNNTSKIYLQKITRQLKTIEQLK